MDNAQVEQQIKQMVQFIKQEAQEKAAEIELRAEEEFNIEKGRLVQHERVKVVAQYERKEKLLETEKKIKRSNVLNQARLKVLQAQDEQLQAIFAEAQQRLDKVAADAGKYKKLLQDLLVQGLCSMLEPTVDLRVRQKDVGVLKSIQSNALSEYKKLSGLDCILNINEKDFLEDECGGGVELATKNGKIKIVNTLERRLRQAHRQLLPATRITLLGTDNSSRKHFT